jgi:hypothetical protein
LKERHEGVGRNATLVEFLLRLVPVRLLVLELANLLRLRLLCLGAELGVSVRAENGEQLVALGFGCWCHLLPRAKSSAPLLGRHLAVSAVEQVVGGRWFASAPNEAVAVSAEGASLTQPQRVLQVSFAPPTHVARVQLVAV